MPREPWTPAEEREIDKSAEARVRAHRILQGEQEVKEKAEREEHEKKEKEERERKEKEEKEKKGGSIDIL